MMVTLVTTIHQGDKWILRRFLKMFYHFTDPEEYDEWIIINNASDPHFKGFAKEIFETLPKVRYIQAPFNMYDIRAYNWIKSEIKTKYFIGIQPDVRLFTHRWIESFIGELQDPSGGITYGEMAGRMYGHLITKKNYKTHEEAWIGELFDERNWDFVDCSHIQTHFFIMNTKAFKAVDGFTILKHRPFSPEKRDGVGGDLIAAEVEMGTKLKRYTYTYRNGFPEHAHYHELVPKERYGDIDNWDMEQGWAINFLK